MAVTRFQNISTKTVVHLEYGSSSRGVHTYLRRLLDASKEVHASKGRRNFLMPFFFSQSFIHGPNLLLLLSALQLFVSFGLLNYFFPLPPLLRPLFPIVQPPSSSNHSLHRLPIVIHGPNKVKYYNPIEIFFKIIHFLSQA